MDNNAVNVTPKEPKKPFIQRLRESGCFSPFYVTVMLLFAVMPTGVLASDNILSDAYWKLFGKSGADVFLTEFSGQNGDV